MKISSIFPQLTRILVLKCRSESTPVDFVRLMNVDMGIEDEYLIAKMMLPEFLCLFVGKNFGCTKAMAMLFSSLLLMLNVSETAGMRSPVGN